MAQGPLHVVRKHFPTKTRLEALDEALQWAEEEVASRGTPGLNYERLCVILVNATWAAYQKDLERVNLEHVRTDAEKFMRWLADLRKKARKNFHLRVVVELLETHPHAYVLLGDLLDPHVGSVHRQPRRGPQTQPHLQIAYTAMTQAGVPTTHHKALLRAIGVLRGPAA